MSKVFSQEVITPANKSEECPVFLIEDARESFTFTDVTVPGDEYTLSLWIKSDVGATVSVENSVIHSDSNWSQHAVTYTASSTDLILDFETPGTYYIYHLQLEVGNMATDWTPAPEDADDFAIALVKLTSDSFAVDIQSVNNSVSNLSASMRQTSEAFEVEVQKVRSDFTGELDEVRGEIASFKVESDEIRMSVQSIKDAGADKVITTTGTFDEAGLTIDKSDSVTKTQITPDGMTVYAKDNDDAVMLEATSAGVEAKDLHATTFLKVGGRSRFENYGNDRTGCFWIGGD